jgi:NADH-quinone oxidoreductase subunit C
MSGGDPAEEGAAPPEPERWHGALVERPLGQTVLHVTPDRYLDVARALLDDGFAMCLEVTGVDYLTHPGRSLPAGVVPERFEVVAQLLSFERRERVRLRVQVADGQPPTVASLFDVFPGVEASERETYDMYGIEFTGHPDLTRILMPEDWEGHPLRKDYAVGRIPVQFKVVPRRDS